MIMDARNKSLNDEQAQEIVQDNYQIFWIKPFSQKQESSTCTGNYNQ